MEKKKRKGEKLMTHFDSYEPPNSKKILLKLNQISSKAIKSAKGSYKSEKISKMKEKKYKVTFLSIFIGNSTY